MNKKCNNLNLKKDTTYHKSKKQFNNKKNDEDSLNDKIALNIKKSPELGLISDELKKDNNFNELKFRLFPLEDNMDFIISKIDKLKIYNEDRIL